MVHTINRLCVWSLLSAFAGLFIAGCGGGGGGGSTAVSSAPPYIFASVISFQTGAAPAGFAQNGSNSVVVVEVLDNTSGEALANASVSINGVPLAYNAGSRDFEGEIVVAPAEIVALRVTVRGATYTASVRQFTSYPVLTAPLANSTWDSGSENLVAWSSVIAPTSIDSVYAISVLDANGEVIWPPGRSVQVLPANFTSYPINAGSVSPGSLMVIAGAAIDVTIPSAAAGSAIVVGGFSYVPVTVATLPPVSTNPLVSIAVTPATPTVAVAGTQQLTATGTYFNSTTQDLTAQVVWSTSDVAKATVSTTGFVTGAGFGSATIIATLGAVAGTATVSVFQPNPSPAPPLTQAVTYQIDYAHTGFATFGAALSFPSTPTWSVTLNGPVSYPLIAGGKVFVTTSIAGSNTQGTLLYALDKQTGNIAWGPLAIPSRISWSGHAYDHGKIFVVNYDGLLSSFDAATGQAGWSTQLPGQYAFDSPPTAVNGVIYVGGAGSGGTLYAVDEADGKVLWTAGVANGNVSSPAVSSDGVFVTYPCQAYKFDPLTGSSLWQYNGPCSGGGGRTAAYANGLLYMRDPAGPSGVVFDGAAGTQVGTFTALTTTPIPAFSAQTGFLQNDGNLQGIDLGTHNVLWNFSGDGLLVSAPIVIDSTVIVGSSSGNVYAVNATTGLQTWSAYAGAPIAVEYEMSPFQPRTGLGAGEGYLVVPAGSVLTAWHLSGP